jgi:outer membrane protein assembly factor BamE (lipoprotein component of BamABCDE complex)
MRCFSVAVAFVVFALAGCTSPAIRIRDDPSAFAGLDAATQERVQQGKIAIGDSEAAVRLALGRPRRIDALPDGAVWFYTDRPRDPNDYITGGFRHRVVFDPVTRTNVVTIEPVDDRLFPYLRTHTIRVSIRNGRVTAVATDED